jgi:hypothetical protein
LRITPWTKSAIALHAFIRRSDSAASARQQNTIAEIRMPKCGWRLPDMIMCETNIASGIEGWSTIVTAL